MTYRCEDNPLRSCFSPTKSLLRELITLPSRKKGEYESAWAKPWNDEARLFYKNGELVPVRRSERTLSIVEYIEDRMADAETIAEYGSGRGDIIGLLAERHPDRKFYAIELTETGSKNHPVLPNLEVIRGDMTKDGVQTDFAYTHLSIEQLPRDYMKAFRNIRARTHRALFMEEFSEGQTFLQRLYLLKRDLFCQSYMKVEKAGFEILEVHELPIQKFRYKTVCILAE